MAYRGPDAAPASRIPEERRGPVVGRFCLTCGAVYPLHAGHHKGKAIHGKDHIAAPCAHEGEAFAEGEGWWEPAVSVIPPPPEPEEGEGGGEAG